MVNGEGALEDEFCGGACEGWFGAVIGDETLDFESPVDLFISLESNLAESFDTAASCFDDEAGTWDCLISPYNTSATSISISSWFTVDDFGHDFGGFCLGPLCAIFFLQETFEEDGDKGADNGEGTVGAAVIVDLTGDGEA